MTGEIYEMQIMFPDATGGDTSVYGDAIFSNPQYAGYLYEMRIKIEVF